MDGTLAGITMSSGIAATLSYMIGHRGGWSGFGVAVPSGCLMSKVVKATEKLESWMRGGKVLHCMLGWENITCYSANVERNDTKASLRLQEL